jgi:hypothetical protein
MSAFGCIADITLPVLQTIYDRNGPQIQVPPGANPFSVRIAVTLLVTTLHFQKGLF